MEYFSKLNPLDATSKLLKLDQNESRYNSKSISKHIYALSSTPVEKDKISLEERVNKIYDQSFTEPKNYFEICEANKLDLNVLPELPELITLLLKWIKYGISDYNHFYKFVSQCANPWIFDFSSRMHSQANKNICPFCGKKINSKTIIESLKNEMGKDEVNYEELLQLSTIYMSNPIFPSFYIKTINVEMMTKNESNFTILCKECSDKYTSLLQHSEDKLENSCEYLEEESNSDESSDEGDLGETANKNLDDLTIQSEIINRNIKNFIKINDISNIQYSIIPALLDKRNGYFAKSERVNLNELGRIYDFSPNASSESLNNALHYSFLSHFGKSHEFAILNGEEIYFSICFATFLCPDEVQLTFAEEPKDQFEFFISIQGYEGNAAVLKQGEQFCYEIKKGDHQYVQSIDFRFKSIKESMNLALKSIEIKGTVEKSGQMYKESIASNNYNQDIVLPAFKKTVNWKWNQLLRSQILTPNKTFPNKVSGIAIKLQSLPKYFIIAFYLNKNIVHTVPIILPSNISEVGYISREPKVVHNKSTSKPKFFYFPISNQLYEEFKFDMVTVFYIEKSESVTQDEIMLF